jgi:hypothetical protein
MPHLMISVPGSRLMHAQTLTELSEDVHVVIFFVAVAFLAQTLVLALIGTLQKRYWRRYEVCVCVCVCVCV